MGIAHYIRVIGRGKDGARALDRAQANDLMSQLLDGALSDLEVGAFALAMRIKGESLEELIGFHEAVRARCLRIASARPVLLLPSYNGARKLPNLTPLLALLLAREDVPVLVHGPAGDDARVASATLFERLGLPFARDAAEAASAWARHEPAYMTTASLCPPLARLLDVRRVVGVRNSGHTLAKLLEPIEGGAALHVVNTTHRDYAELAAQFVRERRLNALLLRGTEGEPFADPRRAPRLDVHVDGVWREDLSSAAQEGVLSELPALPREHDATATARYIRQVLEGALPVPAPLAGQVETLRRVWAMLPRTSEMGT
jgi:anthranilate phosphoribosyltransferase